MFQSITHYAKTNFNPKAALMWDILKFVKDEKDLGRPSRNSYNNKGLVYNVLQHKQLFEKTRKSEEVYLSLKDVMGIFNNHFLNVILLIITTAIELCFDSEYP